jgi:hypothetical protein
MALAACAPPPPTVPTIQAAATQAVPTVQAVATQAAPTVQAAQTAQRATVTAVAPTVQSVATQGTAALQATATAVAPTAQALATQVAPTVQAVSTQAVIAVSTSVAESPVQITRVEIDPEDTRIIVTNKGTSPVNLLNWTLLFGKQVYMTLPSIDLEPNATRTLHLSFGQSTPTDIYLGLGSTAVSSTLSADEQVVLVSPSAQIASVYRPT